MARTMTWQPVEMDPALINKMKVYDIYAQLYHETRPRSGSHSRLTTRQKTLAFSLPHQELTVYRIACTAGNLKDRSKVELNPGWKIRNKAGQTQHSV